MKEFQLLLLSLIVPFISFTQELPVTPIEDGEFDVSQLNSGSIIMLELAHPNHFYRDTDTIQVFGPGSKTGFLKIECYGTKCLEPEVSPEDRLVIPGVAEKRSFQMPLKVRLAREPKKGSYEVSVIKNGTVHHKRTFRIVDPEPTIDSVMIRGFDGVTRSNVLKISKAQSLGNIRFQITGTNVESNFESVSIQHLPLKKHPTEIATYVLGEEWTSEAIARLALGESELVFKRKHSNKLSKQKIRLESDPPVINEPGLIFPARLNENKISMALSVRNLYPGAKLEFAAHPKHKKLLQNLGVMEAEVFASKGTITREVFFNAEQLTDEAKFIVKVINKDGQSSAPKTITIIRKEENVEAIAYDENLPLLAGSKNRILFKQLGGKSFDLDTNSDFKLSINGREAFAIVGRRESAQSFSALVDLPEGIHDLHFVLSKEDKSTWAGSINGILVKPVVTMSGNQVFRGGKLKVFVQNAQDIRILHIDELINIAEVANGSDKVFEISIDRECRLSQFNVVVMLKEHIILDETIKITNWPVPQKKEASLTSKQGSYRDSTWVMSKEGSVRLAFDYDKQNPQRYAAQFIKADGTRLGVPKPLILDEESEVIQTTLSTSQVGIQRGEPFNIEISNPAGEAILIPGYIRRSARQQWIITAGVSVLNIPLGDSNDEDHSNSTVFEGINLAGFYMFENIKNPENRVLGIGPNLLISEDNGKVGWAGAISTLWFEKFVLGLSFSGDGPGLLMGVNIELADLGTLFGGE